MARVFQDTRQKRELGAKAPWWVEWRVGGKRYSKKVGPKMQAQEVARQVERDQINTQFNLPVNKCWSEFRSEYEETIVKNMRSNLSKKESKRALTLFEKIARPVMVRGIGRKLLDDYAAERRGMPGVKIGSKVSPETIKKELRTIRAALGQAREWGYLPVVPTMPTVDGFEKIKRFMTSEHYTAIWKACDQARMPEDFASPADWWRALLKIFWVTGTRVGAILTATWDDTNLDRGFMILRARNTKQKKDHVLRVGQAVPELRAILQLRDPRVFPWNHHRRTLDVEWDRIQEAAKIDLPCPDAADHECRPSCHLYGFHDIRRSHATFNAGRVDDKDLQRQMGHSSFETTKRYIKIAADYRDQSYDAFLPEMPLPAALPTSNTADVVATCG